MNIIIVYVCGSLLSGDLIIKSDSFIAVQSLSSHRDNLLELGSLSSYFLNFIDSSSTVFSHVYRSSNYLSHLLTKVSLLTNFPLECSQNIPSNVPHTIF